MKKIIIISVVSSLLAVSGAFASGAPSRPGTPRAPRTPGAGAGLSRTGTLPVLFDNKSGRAVGDEAEAHDLEGDDLMANPVTAARWHLAEAEATAAAPAIPAAAFRAPIRSPIRPGSRLAVTPSAISASVGAPSPVRGPSRLRNVVTLAALAVGVDDGRSATAAPSVTPRGFDEGTPSTSASVADGESVVGALPAPSPVRAFGRVIAPLAHSPIAPAAMAVPRVRRDSLAGVVNDPVLARRERIIREQAEFTAMNTALAAVFAEALADTPSDAAAAPTADTDSKTSE